MLKQQLLVKGKHISKHLLNTKRNVSYNIKTTHEIIHILCSRLESISQNKSERLRKLFKITIVFNESIYRFSRFSHSRKYRYKSDLCNFHPHSYKRLKQQFYDFKTMICMPTFDLHFYLGVWPETVSLKIF